MGKTKEYAKRTKECADILKIYRARINDFKTKHRNQFIAHRNDKGYPDPFDLPDYRTEFREIIQLALSALQCMWGGPIDFGFHLGSRDPTLDFKKALGVA